MKVLWVLILCAVGFVPCQLEAGGEKVAVVEFAKLCKTVAVYSFDAEKKLWVLQKVYAGKAPKTIELYNPDFYPEERKKHLMATPKILFEYQDRNTYVRKFDFLLQGKLHFHQGFLSGTTIPESLGIDHSELPIVVEVEKKDKAEK